MTINKSAILMLPFLIVAVGTFSGGTAALDRSLIWTTRFNVYHGSIVGRNKVDGLSGATKSLHSGTIGVEYNLKGHYLQGLVTLGRTRQTLSYHLPSEGISGERSIDLWLLDIPLMYNFHFFTRERFGRDNPRLILSTGGFVTFLLHESITDSSLSSPHASSWALGPFVRAAFFPFAFRLLQPGVFLELYRSFAPTVYDDRFFKENGISGQLGILNTGFSLRF
jgi:hypothetical protein